MQPLAKRTDVRDWFYVPVWKCLPNLAAAADVLGAADASSSCILFDDGTGLGDVFAHLGRRFRHVVRVRAAARFSNSARNYTIDPLDASAYVRLLRHVTEMTGPPAVILHAWSIAAGERSLESSEDGQLDRNLISVLHLCQALGECHDGRELQLLLLTDGAHAVVAGDQVQPEHAMLTAIAGVVAKELPWVVCRAIDVAVPMSARRQRELIAAILAERLAPPDDSVIAYRGPSRWVRTTEPLPPPAPVGAESLLRENGAYLITGGLGEIGLALAESLAGSFRARLMLTTRSEFPAPEHWQRWLAERPREDRFSRAIERIRRMESAGARVLVLKADVTVQEQMNAVAALAVTSFGRLDGVIHTAGVARSALIQRVKAEMAADVLAPKTIGTQVLWRAVRDLDPIFFVCCSSLASILSPPGQYAYCAANAYQDAFIQAQDPECSTKFISINWDAWSEGGISTDKGLDLEHGMTRTEGREVFDLVLRSPLPQWLICTRELQMLQRWQLANRRESAISARGERDAGRNVVEPRNEMERALVRIWAEVLGIPDIGVFDDFFELGGDSLLAIQLNSRMQKVAAQPVQLKQLVSHPTIAELAQLLASEA
ncbi:MAG: SDR family oxidoreductase [Steroidobacteraceae bacterium]